MTFFPADPCGSIGAWIRDLVADHDAVAIIPDRSNRKTEHAFSPTLYCERNRIERLFNRLKHYRRIATCYEKLAASYLAMLKLAAIRIWLKLKPPVNESTA